MDWKRRSGSVVGSVLVEGEVPAVYQLLWVLGGEGVSQVLLPKFGQQAGLGRGIAVVASETVVVGKFLVQLEQGGEDEGGWFHVVWGGGRFFRPCINYTSWWTETGEKTGKIVIFLTQRQPIQIGNRITFLYSWMDLY